MRPRPSAGARSTSCALAATPTRPAPRPAGAHDPPDQFRPRVDPLPAQLGVDAPVPVGAVVGVEHLADLPPDELVARDDRTTRVVDVREVEVTIRRLDDAILLAGKAAGQPGIGQHDHARFLDDRDQALVLEAAAEGGALKTERKGVSLYDYYYVNTGDQNAKDRKVFLTDSGRTVYGGGGITPDVHLTPMKYNDFQSLLLAHYIFQRFAEHYVVDHKVARDFEVNNAVLNDFENFLKSKNISFTPANIKGVLVADVMKGGPASKAGLKRGDVIVDFNGEQVSDSAGCECRRQPVQNDPVLRGRGAEAAVDCRDLLCDDAPHIWRGGQCQQLLEAAARARQRAAAGHRLRFSAQPRDHLGAPPHTDQRMAGRMLRHARPGRALPTRVA